MKLVSNVKWFSNRMDVVQKRQKMISLCDLFMSELKINMMFVFWRARVSPSMLSLIHNFINPFDLCRNTIQTLTSSDTVILNLIVDGLLNLDYIGCYIDVSAAV